MVIHEVGMRIKHVCCPKCGSPDINIVWRADESDIISYECNGCKQVTKESSR